MLNAVRALASDYERLDSLSESYVTTFVIAARRLNITDEETWHLIADYLLHRFVRNERRLLWNQDSAETLASQVYTLH